MPGVWLRMRHGARVAGILVGVAGLAGASLAQAPVARAGVRQPSCRQLPNWDSPYMGHTGTPDGKGADFLPSRSILADLDVEAAEGMHWTHQPVHWKKWEQDGPTNWDDDVHGAWASMDQF